MLEFSGLLDGCFVPLYPTANSHFPARLVNVDVKRLTYARIETETFRIQTTAYVALDRGCHRLFFHLLVLTDCHIPLV